MLLLPVAQKPRGFDTWSLKAGTNRVTTRQLLVTKIGLRPEAEPLSKIDQVKTCRCNRSHRSFAPDAIKKATALAMDVPLSLLMRHRVQMPLQYNQKQARSLCLALDGAHLPRGRYGLINRANPRLLLKRLQGLPVLLEITKVLLLRNRTILCRR